MPKESAMPHASLGHLVQAAVGWAVLAGWAWFGQAEPAQAAGPPEPLLAVALFPSVVGGTGQTGGLSGRAAGSSSEPPAAGATAQAVGPPSRTVRVWGEVGVHPVDRQAACQEAEQNALNSLYEQLNSLAQELASQRLSRRQLTVEYAWLLAQPGVEQSQQMDVQEKPYGLVARQEITLRLPMAVLARWSQRLQDLQAERTAWLIGGAVGTLLVWLVGFLLTGLVDRATGAYYRTPLVVLMLLVLSVLTVLGWWWIGTKTFDPPGPSPNLAGPCPPPRVVPAYAGTQYPAAPAGEGGHPSRLAG